MSEPSRWQSPVMLEERRWSLLPSIGATSRHAMLAQYAWAVHSLAAVAFRWPVSPWLFVSWFAGAWAVFYISRRLAGRSAPLNGVSPPVSPDSAFQYRLVFDLLNVLLLAASCIELWFGPNAVHRFLSS